MAQGLGEPQERAGSVTRPCRHEVQIESEYANLYRPHIAAAECASQAAGGKLPRENQAEDYKVRHNPQLRQDQRRCQHELFHDQNELPRLLRDPKVILDESAQVLRFHV